MHHLETKVANIGSTLGVNDLNKIILALATSQEEIEAER